MTTKRSPAPLFHAATKRVRDELYAAYYGFQAAFWEASEKWRSGDLAALALFPEGCFPPAPLFVSG